jgi:TonB family protein
LRPTRLALLATILFAQLTLSAGNKNKTEGAALLAKAAETVNIQAPGSQPFRMKALIRLQMSGRTVEATYRLVWVSDKLWREELDLPGYTEIRVGGESKYWYKRNLDYVPVRVTQAYDAIHFHLRVGLGTEEQVKKVRQRQVKGAQLACIEVAAGESRERELCLDTTTSTVTQMQADSVVTYEFGDYSRLGNKLYPRTLQVLEEGRLAVEAKVEELVPEEGSSPTLFVPPQGASELPYCSPLSITPGKLLTRVTPSYPGLAKMSRQSGTVVMHTVIAPDGTPKDLTVVQTAGNVLDEAALEAVRLWRYKPYRCNGTPIQVETLIYVNFSLQ